MKYISKFENYFYEDDYDEEDDYNPLEDINDIDINDTVYHGSIRDIDDEVTDLSKGYSDWDSIWVTYDENIAKDFSELPTEDEVQIIYKINLDVKNIAKIDNDFANELKDYFGIEDFREIIPILIDNGYNGWLVNGSISRKIYDDIAIFYTEYLKSYTIKIITEEIETDYMTLSDANDYLEKLRN